MNSKSELPARIAFGRFSLMPRHRELLFDDHLVELGDRAFDVLVALIDARGAIVSKDALMSRVWPNQVVEENNLEVQISALRTALGDHRGLIRTVSRRGYQFTGEIRFVTEDGNVYVGAGRKTTPPVTNLPQPVSKLIGRDQNLREILDLAAAHRFVTLTGPGGIGKTRLALAAARQSLPQYRDGVWLADLAPLSDPGLVPTAVAAATGLEFADGNVTAERVAHALDGKEVLLVLDNCEHLIDAAALTVEALLRANSAGRVIATSREPLRAEGEQVYPVSPLAVPAEDSDDKTDPLEYGAVRLFVERARATKPQFALDRPLMAKLAVICRRLDGIPLAIELAAARAATLGIEELAVRLDERFNLLTGGRRTALPRHQTLRATLDWSYELLAEPERILLRRLAIFSGTFSLKAAIHVAGNQEPVALDVIEGLSSLVAKSLVASGVESAIARYRLLDTTHAYALEKLTESGEREQVAHRHAEYYRDVFERAETELGAQTISKWLADFSDRIDNLRSALDWSFSARGDASIGVALTAAAVPGWMQLSLVDECRSRVEEALAALRAGVELDTQREMKTFAALGTGLLYTRGEDADIGTLWTKALEIAERLGDAEYQLRSFWGLWSYHIGHGDPRVALDWAQRFRSLVAKGRDASYPLIGELMTGVAQHYLGSQSAARAHIEDVIAHDAGFLEMSNFVRFPINPWVLAQVFLARILWLQGYPSEAMRAVERSISDARAVNHANTLCYVLALAACPIAFFMGDSVATEYYVGQLRDHSAKHSLVRWHAWSDSYQGMLHITQGDIDAGLRLLRAGLLEELGDRHSTLRLMVFEVTETLGRAGKIAEGLAVAQEAIEPSESHAESWRTPELLRVKGELLLLQGEEGARAAEDQFRQAIECAGRQGALSWELRAVMSIARLLREQGRSADAKALLQPVYDRFTEGFDTVDLKAAKALLDTPP